MNAIVVNNLSKKYKDKLALDKVSFTVNDNSFFALLGLNGAGKSTIINILSDLCKYDSGSLSVLGMNFSSNREEIRRCMGIMPQEVNIMPFITVEKELMYHIGYYGYSYANLSDWIEYLLHHLQLSNYRKTQIFKLSGGMKRRLLLLRALSTKPKIALLDEPTVGVDLHLRQSIYDLLREVHAAGTSIVLTTHYLEEADNLCSEYALLMNGKIIQQGLMSDIKGEVPLTLMLTFRHLPHDLKLSPGVTKINHTSLEMTLSVDKIISEISLLHSMNLELLHLSTKSQLESYFKQHTVSDKC